MNGSGQRALVRFVGRLQRLHELAGAPSLNRMVALTADLDHPLRRSTISDKLNAKSLPEWDFVVSFIAACREYAEQNGRPLPDDTVDLTSWDAEHWRMLRVIDRAQAGERLALAATNEISHRTSPPGAADPARLRVVPQQLPATTRHFAGRAGELAFLNALADQTARERDAVPIVAIEGTAGIGKTALAVYWGHRVADRFPDGQLYVNLRGFSPTESATSPTDALSGFLEALGVPPDQIPATLPARAALYRSLLAGKRVLVVLDNAWDAEQVRPLLPGTSPCLVVVTSRNQLTSLVANEGARWLRLDLLSHTESRELLEIQVGRDRLAAEPLAVDELITGCARLPLALSIVAARAATHPDHSLAVLAEELRSAPGHLDALDGGCPTTDVRSVFSWSYRQVSPDAARLFRLLGLHPGPEISAPAAASLAGQPVAQVRRLLNELIRAHLLTEPRANRYTFHDLLRAYAGELGYACDGEADRRAATMRMLDHYLHAAHRASTVVHPGQRDPAPPAPPVPGVASAPLADPDAALAWFATEHPALLATVTQAAAAGFDTHAYQLARAVSAFLLRQGRWPEMVATQRIALEAARRRTDRTGQAYAHRDLGMAAVELGDGRTAETHLTAALQLFAAIGDRSGEAGTHLGFSRALERQDRHRDALAHAIEAYELYRAADDQAGQANALNSAGWCHALVGEHQRALAACQGALALTEQTGNRWVAAAAWDSLGYVHHRLGEHRRAVACYERALDLCRELGDRPHEAETLVHLADAYHAAGAMDAAGTAWHQALRIRVEFDHPGTDEIRRRLRQLDGDRTAELVPQR